MGDAPRSILTLFFDGPLERKLRRVQEDLREVLSNPSTENTHRPHITMACYEGMGREQLDRQLLEFCNERARFPIEFRAFGIFPHTSTVFAAPVETGDLLESQRELLVHFGREVLFPHHLEPDRWCSHCTLVSGSDAADLARVTDYLARSWEDQAGFVEAIGIVEAPSESVVDRRQMRFAG